MVLTKSRRTRRILRFLSESQQRDQTLAPSSIPLIRYNLLHNHHRCVQVFVQLADPIDASQKLAPHHDSPQFLYSQFAAQKITDSSSLWAQTLPILEFLRASLRPSDNNSGFPTLFHCYSRENHRSYLFFAFVDFRMASQTYTARDLLRMRNMPVQRELCDRLQNKLRRDMDLSEC